MWIAMSSCSVHDLQYLLVGLIGWFGFLRQDLAI
jgi:hypothetical protein